jgi:hypothetical protein
MQKLFLSLAAMFGLLPSLSAQTWDATKPATSSALVSADIRSNWTALQQSVTATNMLADPTFIQFRSASFTYWALGGAGATVAQTGTGLGDTTRKAGDFAAKITSAAVMATFQQTFAASGAHFTKWDFLKGQTISAGAWVKCSTASKARIGIYDGIGTTYSSFHTGGGNFEWLTVTRTIDASATQLIFSYEVSATSIASYISAPTMVQGPVPPGYFLPGYRTGRIWKLYEDMGAVRGNTNAAETDLSVVPGGLPAGTLWTNDQYYHVRFKAVTAANGNTKTLKLYIGATSTTLLSAAANAVTYWIDAYVIRTGASAEGVQYAVFANNANPVFAATTPAENLATDLALKITGQGTATNDVQTTMFFVEVVE